VSGIAILAARFLPFFQVQRPVGIFVIDAEGRTRIFIILEDFVSIDVPLVIQPRRGDDGAELVGVQALVAIFVPVRVGFVLAVADGIPARGV